MTDASRRNFLKVAGLAGASAWVPAASAQTKTGKAKAKNLIFLVVDGMGTGTLSLAHAWQKHVKGKGLEWLDFYDSSDCVRSFQDTASANSPVTDSAAAASAWGCGHRVNNGAINVTPDGKHHKPIFQYAKEAGKATGVVSTCRITHATPAGFVTAIESRNSEDEIAQQYLKQEMDVYLGGGMRHFKRDDADLVAQFAAKGYAIAKDMRELKVAEKYSRVLGLFSDGHVPYMIDREHDRSLKNVPGLEAMLESSLEVLSRKPEGFVLQVESGRVDHAGHDNDPATILHEMLEFDRCIKIAEKFQKTHPDTLFILTTDHGTGGCQMNGVGSKYNDTFGALDNLTKFTGSFESLEASSKELGHFDGVTFEKITGIPASQEKIDEVAELLPKFGDYFNAVVAKVFEKELFELTGVGWTSNNHTAEHVEFASLGPGSELFPKSFDNNAVFGILREALAI